MRFPPCKDSVAVWGYRFVFVAALAAIAYGSAFIPRSGTTALDWQWWFEFTKAAAPVVTAGCALFAARTAYRGLRTWRDSERWKRKSEVAHNSLRGVLQFRDLIMNARRPFVLAAELIDENGTQVPANLAPRNRIHAQREFFIEFQEMKYAFMAQFGLDKANLFQRCVSILNNVLGTSETMAQFDRVDIYPEMRDVIFIPVGRPDTIAAELDGIVAEFEASCRPVIDAVERGS